jgi:hypothetical protein
LLVYSICIIFCCQKKIDYTPKLVKGGSLHQTGVAGVRGNRLSERLVLSKPNDPSFEYNQIFTQIEYPQWAAAS